MNTNDKKAQQLGMPFGTASNKLRKMILFKLLGMLNLNACFRCHLPIALEELSIEHKVAWLDTTNPVDTFFDLDNIAFSHVTCNTGAARKPTKYPSEEKRIEAKRAGDRKAQRKYYRPERRHDQYITYGH